MNKFNVYIEEENEQIRSFITKSSNLMLDRFMNNPGYELDYSSIKSFNIVENIISSVKKFQEKHNLLQNITDDNNGRALGKVISIKNEQILENYIFIESSLFIAYFYNSENKFIEHTLVHTTHHELAHAHDDFVKSKDIGIDFFFCEPTDYLTQHQHDANAIWSEYIANRLSSSTFKKDINNEINDLFGIISEVKEVAVNLIVQFCRDGNAGALFFDIKRSTSFLLYKLANIIGTIQGLNLEKENLYYKANEFLFKEILEKFENEFIILYQHYGNWKDPSIFFGLIECLFELWRYMGINAEAQPDGTFYIKIVEDNF